jgi:SnoaL-like protein
MNRCKALAAITLLTLSAGCSKGGSMSQKVREFALDYTAAWCSQRPAKVAEHFSQNGSLTINGGTPSVGRAAITTAAQGFMTAFPDMVVSMDSLSVDGSRAVYHWMLTGTNSGPGGTGKRVRIHGYEEWTIGSDGLIQTSLGHYDQAEYDRQLREGAAPNGE